MLADSIGAFIFDYYPDDASNVRYIYSESGGHNETQLSLGSQLNDRLLWIFHWHTQSQLPQDYPSQ
ncbi:MAG: hypothetical protein U5L96_10125 [Owenweeksia sp.]|nr:hypothetical protein [Owenweeksia sp.]